MLTTQTFLTHLFIYLFIYEFLSRISSSVLKVNCYQWGSCVGRPSVFNSPFGHRSRSHNICPLDNHLSGLSISLSSLVLSWVYRLPFFKSLVWLGCDSNSQPSVLVASTLPLQYQSVLFYTFYTQHNQHQPNTIHTIISPPADNTIRSMSIK